MLKLDVRALRHMRGHLSSKLLNFYRQIIMLADWECVAACEQHWEVHSSAVLNYVFYFPALSGRQSDSQEGNVFPRLYFRVRRISGMGKLGASYNFSDYLQYLNLHVL